MKRLENYISIFVTLFCVAYLGWDLVPKRASHEFETGVFGSLPVLLNGRLKPIDTVARNALLIIHGKRTFKFEDGENKRTMPAVEWLLEVVYDAPAANGRKVFLIHNQDVLSLIGAKKDDGKLYSYAELTEHTDEILRQAVLADAVEAQLRTPFQQHAIKLQNQLALYQKLQHSLQHPGATEVAGDLQEFMRVVEPGIEASTKRDRGEPYDEEAFETMTRLAAGFIAQAGHGFFFPVPPADPSAGVDGWRKVGDAMMMAADEGGLPPAATAYADMGDAFRARDPSAFLESGNVFAKWLQKNHGATARKAGYEAFFNAFSPFYKSMVFYVLAFLLACFFWLSGSNPLCRAAMVPLFVALAIHVFGLVSRMVIEGRPPVTNLY